MDWIGFYFLSMNSLLERWFASKDAAASLPVSSSSDSPLIEKSPGQLERELSSSFQSHQNLPNPPPTPQNYQNLPPNSPAISLHVITPDHLGLELEGESNFDQADRDLKRDCTNRIILNTLVGFFGASGPIWCAAYYYRYRMERVGRVRRRLATAALAVAGGIIGNYFGRSDSIHRILHQNRTDSAFRRDQIRLLMRKKPMTGAKLATEINKNLYKLKEEQGKLVEISEKFSKSTNEAYKLVMENQLKSVGIFPEQFHTMNLLEPKQFKYKDEFGFDILL